MYFEAHKDDEQQEFEDEITLLKDSLEVLADLNRQKNQLKGTVQCTNCGQDMPTEADYCSKCGSKLEKPVKEDPIKADDCEADENEQAAEQTADESEQAAEQTADDSENAEQAAVGEEVTQKTGGEE